MEFWPRYAVDMPVFVEDPAQFSKLRLKSELIAHNITLPVAESKKQVYVGLYLKHVAQKSAADFSSEEEDDGQVQDVGVSRLFNLYPCPSSVSELFMKCIHYLYWVSVVSNTMTS